MTETAISINNKTSIPLSRNQPVGLIVGAAGFIGSHLTDKLLEKDIQVIGVDNLETGKRENLQTAVGNKEFHLVIDSAQNLDLDLERLDYLFVVPESELPLERILELFKKTKCRLLFVSSIDLYDKDAEGLEWLKKAESKIAKFAADFNLNARILRLGSVFGPRMNFKTKDPVVKLLQQALTGDLQKDISLEFSSRALYVSDAVDLIIKAVFAGSTAQKIFDGVLPIPIKVSEIKQVLLDPVWYENKDFAPSELPPWPTPNLEKTIRILNWHPTQKLVGSLKNTIQYFKDNEVVVPKAEMKEEKEEVAKAEIKLPDDKKGELELFKKGNEKIKKGSVSRKFSFPFSKIYLFAVIALITYALVWPALLFGWGIYIFQSQLNEGLKNFEKGDFEKSLGNIKEANSGIQDIKTIYDSLAPIRKIGLLKPQFDGVDSLIKLSILSINSAESANAGIQQLLLSLKAITGENNESPSAYFTAAQIELSSSKESVSKAEALLKNPDFNKNLPGVLKPQVESISKKLADYNILIKQAWSMSALLPEVTAIDGQKNYLVLLQNNMELRPSGGFIGSFAKVSFEGGKLKKLEVNDVYAIDGQLGIHVEPPKEILQDLGQKNWFLRDSNWEPDFPTSAREAEWFYNKETGERVEGVIALDISAMENLLVPIGPLDLADYNEKITSDNLFEKAITHAETGFFPGSQAKKSFLTALTNQAFNKVFFMPQNNWPGILAALGKSVNEKHISFYLNDPKLFSYLDSEGWAHALPRQSEQNRNNDFLSIVEANLGANKVNYYLDRNYKLETVISRDGQVSHKMRISYVNRSPSGAFPGGEYKDRMRIYLPFGAKLTSVLWGESNITSSVTSFIDYGRSGYSVLLGLAAKEQKTFVVDYTVPIKLDFVSGKASYRLDVIKQAGTKKDPFAWTITYPISYQLVSDQAKAIGPQEQTISTDLAVDRSFEVEFKK